MRLPRLPLMIGPVAVLALGACAGAPSPGGGATAQPSAGATPVTVTNCGRKVTVSTPPRKAVTMNQGATEVALALGLEKQMVGTAYLDDKVPAVWQAAYSSVPVLAEKYPTKEKFLAAGPDFAYASYESAFSAKGVGERAELAKEGVNTYLSPFGCTEQGHAKGKVTFEKVWGEVADVARIFGVPERAQKLADTQKNQLETLKKASAGRGTRVFWFDSGDTTAFAGGGAGGPQLILDAVGATNVFADIDKGWADMPWEKVVAADPQVIVLADASWSTAASKIAHLEGDPVLKNLAAVKAKRYVTIPFSESTPGVRLVDGATHVAEQIAKLPTS